MVKENPGPMSRAGIDGAARGTPSLMDRQGRCLAGAHPARAKGLVRDPGAERLALPYAPTRPTLPPPMRRLPRPTLLVLACLVASCAARDPGGRAAAAPLGDPASASRGDAVSASRGDDDLGERLRTYLRLLGPDAPAADFAAFLAANPVWPNRGLLAARYDAALAGDPDDAAVRALCAARAPRSGHANARCADATGDAGFARAAWRAGLDATAPDAAASFARQWGDRLGPDDWWARFETLDAGGGRDAAAAADAANHLDAGRAGLARARLLLAVGDVPDPRAVRDAVAPGFRDDPVLVRLVARRLRLSGDLAAAASFWANGAGRVERAVPDAARGPFWTERDLLARALLASGDVATAAAVADDADAAPVEARAASLFLAGWIELRFANRPEEAAARFASLRDLGRSLLTRSRAEYWLARAALAERDAAGADASLLAASADPTTFYGQAAIALLATRPGPPAANPAAAPAATPAAAPADAVARAIDAAMRDDPAATPSPARAMAFASGTLPRAAVLLVAWNQERRAGAFLDLADRIAPGRDTDALAARLALSLGLPDTAVAIARRAGRDGIAMPALGWPAPVTPPANATVPAPLVLAVVRQESGFDAAARSPSGALGLMQLLPSTAAELARRRRIAFTPAALTADPSLNLALGTDYLASLLARFGDDVPLAVAAYNAGPHRAASWPPPPRGASPGAVPGAVPGGATIDWIEAIPVAETRNYVERVLENRAVYAARAAGDGVAPGAGTPLASLDPTSP